MEMSDRPLTGKLATLIGTLTTLRKGKRLRLVIYQDTLLVNHAELTRYLDHPLDDTLLQKGFTPSEHLLSLDKPETGFSLLTQLTSILAAFLCRYSPDEKQGDRP